MSLQAISALIIHYRYALLLPIAIVEGPIVTIIAAFLASTGVLNVYLVYLIAVAGDIIGDCIYYAIGRSGGYALIHKYGKYLGITEERIKAVEAHYDRHFLKTLIFGKVTQAPVLAVIVVAGITKTNFWKFFWSVVLVTIPKALVFTLVGYFLGKSFPAFAHYLDSYLALMWVALILGFIFYWLIKRYRE